MRFLAAMLLLVSLPALGQVEVENPWTRATPPGAKTAAGYMILRNRSTSADRLVGASSPAAGRVETHLSIQDGEVMRMREVQGYAVPAGGSFELRPGGAHLMLVDIRRPFKEGEKIPVLLKFEKSGEVKVELHVGRLGASGHRH